MERTLRLVDLELIEEVVEEDLQIVVAEGTPCLDRGVLEEVVRFIHEEVEVDIVVRVALRLQGIIHEEMVEND